MNNPQQRIDSVECYDVLGCLGCSIEKRLPIVGTPIKVDKMWTQRRLSSPVSRFAFRFGASA